jgi:ribosomal protein L29
MKQSMVKETRAKSVDTLHQQVYAARQKLARLVFDLKSGKTANIKDIRSLKKEIATALTIIGEHEHDKS